MSSIADEEEPNDIANTGALATVGEEMQCVVNETKLSLASLLVTTPTLLPPPGDRIRALNQVQFKEWQGLVLQDEMAVPAFLMLHELVTDLVI